MELIVNGKKMSKKEFRAFIMKRSRQFKQIKKLSKTELGRRYLRGKGINI